ncbi:MAG: c-type cytochrome [Thermodesulfobacteriota bacterium]
MGIVIRRAARTALAVAIALVLGARGAGAAEPDGATLYLVECAPCHGASGRGDGPEARWFVPPPRDLRGGVLDAADEDALVARLRDGAPLPIEPDPKVLRERLARLDDLVAHVERLPTLDWAKVDAGAAVFAERCAVCHGPLGKPLPVRELPPGVQRPPRDLWDAGFQRDTSDDELIAAIQHGHRGMPGIPGLQDDARARALLPFVRLLSPGFETYSYYCAPCHGDEGRGDGVFATGKQKPHVVFDRAWLASENREELRKEVAHMLAEHGARMPHFREALSDAELRAIVRYLKRTD